jgi:ubiquinone biosynthesis protein
VHWDRTTTRLNVQERIEGIPVRDLKAVEAAGLDRKLIARRGAEIILQMILENGFFHADPHPGNIFCLPGNRLALIDFGMVGRMTEPRRTEVVRLLFALAEQDSRGVVDILLDWTDDHPVDAELLTGDVEEFVDTYHDLTLAQLDLGAMLDDMLRVVRDHQIRLPQGLTLLFRALITVEGIGRRLDPEFSVVEMARPFLRRAVRRRYRPSALARRARRNLSESVDILVGMPRDLRRLVRSARRGSIRLNLDLSRLDNFGHQLDRAASRITVGMILGSIIIGTAIVMTLAERARIFGVPLLGVLGFASAIVAGVWILASIRRGSRN